MEHHYTVYLDITPDGTSYTVYDGNHCVGTFLPDDIAIAQYFKKGTSFKRCDWR